MKTPALMVHRGAGVYYIMSKRNSSLNEKFANRQFKKASITHEDVQILEMIRIVKPNGVTIWTPKIVNTLRITKKFIRLVDDADTKR